MNSSRKLVYSFGVFVFDLNQGQSCEFCFPDDALSATDRKAISMLCFPDSQSASNSGNFESVYTFSYRVIEPVQNSGSLRSNAEKESCSVEFLQCYVYFRQVEDALSSRGYHQKSFVLMSSWSRSFSCADEMLRLSRRIGNKFYLAEERGCGKDVLIDAYGHVQEYGIIHEQSAASMDLGTGLSSMTMRSLEIPLSPKSSGRLGKIFDELYSLLSGLWHVWESLLAGLPILVHYPGSADMCSRAVLALPSLIFPIRYAGDVRPFLSIFDSDYSYFRSLPGQLPCIVGVTSPMALEQLANSFSIVINFSVEEDSCFLQSSKFVLISASPTARMYLSETVTSISSNTRTRLGSLGLRFSYSAPDSAIYRLALPSDAECVSKRLVTGLQDLSGSQLNRALIQRHFNLLTRDFLVPFLQFVETDSSRINSEYLFACSPKVQEFSPPKFLESLLSWGGIGRHLSTISKEKLGGLYRRFISSETFRDWLSEAQERANFEALIAHAELLVRSMTRDKVVWMSLSERERGMHRVAQLLEVVPEEQVELRLKLSDTMALLN